MAKQNPLDGFTVDRASIRYIGHDLQRPECILAEPDGTLWSADARGGVMRIAADGTQTMITQQSNARFESTADFESRFTQGTLPNGLAFAANGDFLIANFGTDALELGQVRVLANHVGDAAREAVDEARGVLIGAHAKCVRAVDLEQRRITREDARNVAVG